MFVLTTEGNDCFDKKNHYFCPNFFSFLFSGDMAVKKIDYDEDILSKINGFGKWQLCLFMILWLPSAFSAFAVFMYSFIGKILFNSEIQEFLCRSDFSVKSNLAKLKI